VKVNFFDNMNLKYKQHALFNDFSLTKIELGTPDFFITVCFGFPILNG
jgi:hypothetical protein